MSRCTSRRIPDDRRWSTTGPVRPFLRLYVSPPRGHQLEPLAWVLVCRRVAAFAELSMSLR